MTIVALALAYAGGGVVALIVCAAARRLGGLADALLVLTLWPLAVPLLWGGDGNDDRPPRVGAP